MPHADAREPTAVPTPDMLLSAYAQGVFPMADSDTGIISWYSADPRGIIPLEPGAFHVPRRLAKTLRRPVSRGGFDVVIDGDFAATMRACAAARAGHTWISEPLVEAYAALHRLGYAHSVETRLEGRLVGGLYGVALGAAFFGESMFHEVTDASKAALAALVARLRERGFELLDAQALTPHLAQFGCVEIPRREYLSRLARALKRDCRFT